LAVNFKHLSENVTSPRPNLWLTKSLVARRYLDQIFGCQKDILPCSVRNHLGETTARFASVQGHTFQDCKPINFFNLKQYTISRVQCRESLRWYGDNCLNQMSLIIFRIIKASF